MEKDNKAWVRQVIAIMAMIGMLGSAYLAMTGQVSNMAVYNQVFYACAGYVGWFFVSREVEKRK